MSFQPTQTKAAYQVCEHVGSSNPLVEPRMLQLVFLRALLHTLGEVQNAFIGKALFYPCLHALRFFKSAREGQCHYCIHCFVHMGLVLYPGRDPTNMERNVLLGVSARSMERARLHVPNLFTAYHTCALDVGVERWGGCIEAQTLTSPDTLCQPISLLLAHDARCFVF